MNGKPNISAPQAQSSMLKKILVAILIIIAVIIALFILLSLYFSIAQKSTTYYNYGETGTASPGLPGSSSFFAGERQDLKIYEESAPSAGTIIDTSQPYQPKVIKTASLSLVVENVDNAVKQITSQTSGFGGFIQNSSVTENNIGQKFGILTLRVPASNFETLVSQIKSLAKLVEREDISGKEVTEEFVDLQADLTHNQAVEAQYLELLKRAEKVEEIIAVRDKLDQVQAEIERIKGRLRYLENQTEMSTITISLKTEPSITIPAEKWQPIAIIKQSFQRMIVILQNFVNFLIALAFFLISAIPYILLIILFYWLGKKIWRKLYKK